MPKSAMTVHYTVIFPIAVYVNCKDELLGNKLESQVSSPFPNDSSVKVYFKVKDEKNIDTEI